MKKLAAGFAAGLLMFAGSLMVSGTAHALFINGGFEGGNFNGWTLTYGNVRVNTAAPVWGVNPSSGNVTPTILTAATPMQPGQTLDVNPYNGNNMAMINDIDGMYHATMLSQSDTITAGDLGDTLYVNWGAMLVDPRNEHPVSDQPVFSISVTRNGSILNSFFANASVAVTSSCTMPGSIALWPASGTMRRGKRSG